MSILEKLTGFLGGGFGSKMGDVIDQVVRDKDLAEKLKHDVAVLVSQQEHAVRIALIDSEKSAEHELQETIRAELGQTDEYTKRTRPMLARRSWWAVVAYVGAGVISAGATAIPDVPTDWTILMVLASPVLTYMGVRTFDKWKLGK